MGLELPTRVSLGTQALSALWKLRIFPKIQVRAKVVATYAQPILLSSISFFISSLFHGKDSQGSRQMRPTVCLGQAEGHKRHVP